MITDLNNLVDTIPQSELPKAVRLLGAKIPSTTLFNRISIEVDLVVPDSDTITVETGLTGVAATFISGGLFKTILGGDSGYTVLFIAMTDGVFVDKDSTTYTGGNVSLRLEDVNTVDKDFYMRAGDTLTLAYLNNGWFETARSYNPLTTI